MIPSLGRARTDTFASVEEIVAENRLLLDRLLPTSLAVLNGDDELSHMLLDTNHAQVATYGIESFGANLIAYNVVPDTDKTGFDVRYGSERYVGRWIPWLGQHQVAAALAGLTVGLHYDVQLDEGLRALTELPYMPGRMNPLTGEANSLIIDDSIGATPQSVLAALGWLQNIRANAGRDEDHRVFFVVGDVDHLGVDSSQAHRTIGQRAAEVADVIVTEGAEAAMAGRAALDSGMNPRHVCMTYNVQDALQALRERFTLTEHDTVLVTGGATMRMEEVVSALLLDEKDRKWLPRVELLGAALRAPGPTRLSWLELDLEALAGNVRALKRIVGESVTLMAVVKADAYGHGAVAVARTALLNGAEQLAVSSIDEALQLREAGIDAPILLLNYTPPNAVRQALRQQFILTVYDLDMARAYDRAARELGERLVVHVKVDSGMGRLGAMPKDAMSLFRHIINLKNLDVQGIYTHFASADEDQDYTAFQVKTFKDVIKPLRASGFDFQYIHAANSAATLASKDSHFNMVRVGIAMYGLSPSSAVPVTSEFRPVLTWKTIVAQVKTLAANHPVGYGRTYYTQNEERIAVLPVGFADGFRRAPKNWGEVLIHGQRAPVIGRVSMEKTVININDIPDVSVGDEVVLLGAQGDERITAEEIASKLGTSNYEVVTSILPRVPRH
ncbi:MAG: alanine racemase [Anaerolineae bacterium]